MYARFTLLGPRETFHISEGGSSRVQPPPTTATRSHNEPFCSITVYFKHGIRRHGSSISSLPVLKTSFVKRRGNFYARIQTPSKVVTSTRNVGGGIKITQESWEGEKRCFAIVVVIYIVILKVLLDCINHYTHLCFLSSPRPRITLTNILSPTVSVENLKL